jgi:hypothetical protein
MSESIVNAISVKGTASQTRPQCTRRVGWGGILLMGGPTAGSWTCHRRGVESRLAGSR